jgi:hypothetical protein
MKKLNFIESIFVWLAGYDKHTVEHCTPSEIRKVCIAGSMVMVPGLVALFSYGYAFYFIFQNQIPAIVGGIVSSFILIMIDRAIMAYGRPGKFSVGMFGRVCLAILVGFMLAEPLVLKIFEDSIAEQQFSELQLQHRTAATVYNSQISSLETELKKDENYLKSLQVIYTQEMDKSGGTRKYGQGPVYRKKYQDYIDAKTAYNNRAESLAGKINSIESEKQSVIKNITEKSADGLIGRMRALNALGEKEPLVKWTTWLLRIFFCMIELLPLMIKLTPSNDRGLYFELIDINDKEKADIFLMSSEERKTVRKQEEKLRYTQEYSELCIKETQIISSAKEKDTIYLMDRATSIAEKKLDFIAKAIKNIKDPVLLEAIINNLNQIHNGFMVTIDNLLSKSNKNFGSDKT